MTNAFSGAGRPSHVNVVSFVLSFRAIVFQAGVALCRTGGMMIAKPGTAVPTGE